MGTSVLTTRVLLATLLLSAACSSAAEDATESPQPLNLNSLKDDLVDQAKSFLISQGVELVTDALKDASLLQDVASELGLAKVKTFWERIRTAVNGYTPTEAQLQALEGYVAQWDEAKSVASGGICSDSSTSQRAAHIAADSSVRFVAAGSFGIDAGPLTGFVRFTLDSKGVASPAVGLGFTLSRGTGCSAKAELTCSVQGKVCNAKGDDWDCACEGSNPCAAEDLSMQMGDIDIDECKLDKRFYLSQPAAEYSMLGELPTCKDGKVCQDAAGLGSVECVPAPQPATKRALTPKGEAFVDVTLRSGSFTLVPDTLLQLPAPYDYLTFVVNFDTLAMSLKVDLEKYAAADDGGSSDGVRGAYLAGVQHLKSLTMPSLEGVESLLSGFTVMAYKNFPGVGVPIPSALKTLTKVVTPVVNVILEGKIALPFCIGDCASGAPPSARVSGEGSVALVETDRGCRPKLALSLEQLTVGSFAVVLGEITPISGLASIIQATPFAGVGLSDASFSATVLGFPEVELAVKGSPLLGGVDLGVLNVIASNLRVGVSAKIEKDTTTLTLSLASAGIDLGGGFAFVDQHDDGVKFDIANVAGPMPSSRTSVYLPLRVKKPESNPVNGEYLYFSMSTSYVTASTVAGISGTFEMAGTWERAFGIPFVQLSDVSVSLGIDFTIIFEFGLAGKACIGSQQACRDGDSTRSISGGAAIRYDRTDATKNYVMAYLDGSLTARTLFGVFELGSLGLPSILNTDSVGFFPYKDGCAADDLSCKMRFSYSAGVEDAVINGVTVPGGFFLQGALKLPGFHLRGFVQFSRLQGRYEIDMQGRLAFKVGGQEIITIEGTTPGSDARFHVLASVTEGVLVDISGKFNIPLLLSHGSASIRVDGEQVSMTVPSMTLFNGVVSGSGNAHWRWNDPSQVSMHASVNLSPPLTTVSMGSGAIDLQITPSKASFSLSVSVLGYSAGVSVLVSGGRLSFGFSASAGIASLRISVGVELGRFREPGAWMVRVDPEFNTQFAEEVGKAVATGVRSAGKAVLNTVEQVGQVTANMARGALSFAKDQLISFFVGIDSLLGQLDKLGDAAVASLEQLDHTMSEVMNDIGNAMTDVADSIGNAGSAVGGFFSGIGGSLGFRRRGHKLSSASIRQGANPDDAGRALIDVALLVTDAAATKVAHSRLEGLKKKQDEVVAKLASGDFKPSVSSYGNPYLRANEAKARLSLGVSFGNTPFGKTFVHSGTEVDLSNGKLSQEVDKLKASVAQQGTAQVEKLTPQEVQYQAGVFALAQKTDYVSNTWTSYKGSTSSLWGKPSPCDGRGLRKLNTKCSEKYCTFEYTCAGGKLDKCYTVWTFEGAYSVMKGMRLVNEIPLHCPEGLVMSISQKDERQIHVQCCNAPPGYLSKTKQKSACAVKKMFDGEGTSMYRAASCGGERYITELYREPCGEMKGDFHRLSFACQKFDY